MQVEGSLSECYLRRREPSQTLSVICMKYLNICLSLCHAADQKTTSSVAPDDKNKKKKAAKKKTSKKEIDSAASPTTTASGQLAGLAKATGGLTVRIGKDEAPEDVIEWMLSRLPTHKPRKHYQIELLIDVSYSMENDLKRIRDKVEKIIVSAQAQLRQGGSVSIGIKFYVDEVVGEDGVLIHLEGSSALDSRTAGGNKKEILEARKGLDQIIEMFKVYDQYDEDKHDKQGVVQTIINTIAKLSTPVQTDKKPKIDINTYQGIEYHWEAAMATMKGEPWADSPEVEKVIFLITDEDDDGGRNIKVYKQEDVIAEAKRRGIRFELIMLPKHADGGCFTSDTTLRTSTGTITFGELAAMEDRGEDLPFLASFDESTSQIVYQRPTKLLRHPQLKSTLTYIKARQNDGSETTLTATDNHRLLTRKNGAMEWVKAGMVAAGDTLIDPDGEEYTALSLSFERGAFDVFNLSFNPAMPTYLVSSDGRSWFVAHNKKL